MSSLEGKLLSAKAGFYSSLLTKQLFKRDRERLEGLLATINRVDEILAVAKRKYQPISES